VAMRPPIPSITLSRRAKIALWTVAVLIVLIIVLVQLAGVYVNFMWFGSVGFRSVYATMFWTRVTLFFIFGVLMTLIIAGNLVIAYLLSPPFRPMSAEQQNIERYRALLEPRKKLLLIGVAAIVFLSAGLSAQGNWATWQLWLHGGSFGIKDPQFHRDVSFYAWDYPVYRSLLGFGFTAVILSIIFSAVVHYFTGAIRLQTPGPKMTLAARRHITVLAFVFMVFKAIAYWLDRYGLVFSDRSRFTGASYTDVHAVLPARTILFWIAIVIAAGLIASLWLRSTLLPGIAFISLLVLSILISGIYPAILQGVSVKPNASVKEAPYIRKNIQMTRDAYKIVSGSDVNYEPYKASPNPKTTPLFQTDNATLNNVRILDPNIISQTVSKFQQLGGNMYGFAPKLDVDRYTVNGEEHDYIVAVRELDAANLSGQQTNWINEHTTFTHGYGFVAAPANKDITNNGNNPGAFTAGYIPPSGEIPVKNPGVYFGELMPDYSIVGAQGSPQEFDGDGSQKVTYRGSGGVPLNNVFKRLAFAVQYKQSNFLLNNAASAKGAKIIFNRDPREMVQKVAPFLKVDGDPYPIVDGATGDIMWMVDGYTTMDNFPYSERQSLSSLTNDSLAATNRTAKQPNDEINYIRNSVKATVDAYTGQVKLYAWDSSDPVLKAWRNVFPKLVQSAAQMPSQVRAHVRYPEDLFEVQRAMLTQYHVSNPVQFYNVSNKWTVPDDPTNDTATSQPPYYVLASPAASTSSARSVFQLTSPLNVNNSTYLAAYMSVNNDAGRNYGKFTVLQLPRGTQAVQAPEQVYNKITSDPTITKDLTFFNSAGGGSTVTHGNLLTLPVGQSFLYVEPLYNRSSSASQGTYPQLVRVIAVYGDKVGYGQNLVDALSDFEPNHSTGDTLTGTSSRQTSGTGQSPSPGSSSSPGTGSSGGNGGANGGANGGGSSQVTLAQLNQAQSELQAALNSGDLAKIGTAQQAFNKLVAAYLQQQGSGTAKPSPTGSRSPR
jgi:uncharacterized membrane protein (UPF0182 family)